MKKFDEFVTQTHLDITNGVTEAQKQSQLFIVPVYLQAPTKLNERHYSNRQPDEKMRASDLPDALNIGGQTAA